MASDDLAALGMHSPGHSRGLLDIPRWRFLLSLLVKKEMRVLHPLVGDDEDATQLLAVALALASHRVVVKRPRKAPNIGGKLPGYVLEGKSCRYDVYPKRALKARS